MKILQVNNFTQTIGYGNSLKKEFVLKVNPETEILMKDGFKSFQEYLNHYNSGSKKGKAGLFKKLQALKENLQNEYGYYIDPIIYLSNLYYGEGLSIIDTYKRVVKKGMNYSNKHSIEKTFKLVFGWKLRDVSGSEITRKKCKGNMDEAQKTYKKDVEKKYTKIKNYVSDNIYKILSKKNKNFDSNYFESIQYKGKKILYIINVFLGLTKYDLIEINKLGVGARVLSNYLNKRIQIYSKNYNFEMTIYPRNIGEILNQEKNYI